MKKLHFNYILVAVLAAVLLLLLTAGGSRQSLLGQLGNSHFDCEFISTGDGFTLVCKPIGTIAPTQTAPKTPVPGASTQTSTPLPTHSPIPTSAPSTSVPPDNSMQSWHLPGSHDARKPHEHGDKPPEWANEWSEENFGHPVIFGGDEISSDIENSMKHEAYKGVLYRVNTNTSCPVDVYFRYHAASNPMDRSAAFHSFELYMRDCQGGVSFRQGLYWVGYPEFRSQRMTRLNEQAGTILTDGSGNPAPGRDQFIVSAPDRADFASRSKCEQWYAFAGKYGGEFSITICQATTYFDYDEHLGDFHDMQTWELTGGVGLSRRFEVTLYGVTNPRAPTVQPQGWFCMIKYPQEDRRESFIRPDGRRVFVRPTWSIIQNTGSPSCTAGYLAQYTSPTFPSTGISADFGNTLPLKQFPGAGIVEVPN